MWYRILAAAGLCYDDRMPVQYHGGAVVLSVARGDRDVRCCGLPQVEGVGAAGAVLCALCAVCRDLYYELGSCCKSCCKSLCN